MDRIEDNKLIHTKFEQTAIASYLKRKEENLTTFQAIQYSLFELQQYFTCSELKPKEIKIMSILK